MNFTSREVQRAAWREWKHALAYSGLVEEVHALAKPPRWFVGIELGYDVGEAPSLSQTLDWLERANQRSAKVRAYDDVKQRRRSSRDHRAAATKKLIKGKR